MLNIIIYFKEVLNQIITAVCGDDGGFDRNRFSVQSQKSKCHLIITGLIFLLTAHHNSTAGPEICLCWVTSTTCSFEPSASIGYKKRVLEVRGIT